METLKSILTMNGSWVPPNKHLQGGVAWNKNQRIYQYIGSLNSPLRAVFGEIKANGVTDPTFQANWLRQNSMSGSSGKRSSHQVIRRNGVAAGTAGWNRAWSNNGYLHLFPSFRKLWLIPDDCLILHRVWNIADLKLQNSTLRNQSKSWTSP